MGDWFVPDDAEGFPTCAALGLFPHLRTIRIFIYNHPGSTDTLPTDRFDEVIENIRKMDEKKNKDRKWTIEYADHWGRVWAELKPDGAPGPIIWHSRTKENK